MDVINRGMNGYNSRWGLAALPLILEEILGPPSSPSSHHHHHHHHHGVVVGECLENDFMQNNNEEKECVVNGNEQSSSPDREEILIQQHPQYAFLIGYGANDSCLPHGGGSHSRYHVPLDEYASNLTKIIQLIQTWNTNNSKGNKVVAVALLTPPPCDTEKQKQNRDNDNVTRRYAEACLQVANEMNIPVVDLWNGMQLPVFEMQSPSSSSSSFSVNQQWKTEYLSDGLHLTPMGNYRLYELVVELLDRSMVGEEDGSLGMGLAVTNLPRSYPDHSMIDATEPETNFLVPHAR
jgi:lysophospholipase L1-like esterase